MKVSLVHFHLFTVRGDQSDLLVPFRLGDGQSPRLFIPARAEVLDLSDEGLEVGQLDLEAGTFVADLLPELGVEVVVGQMISQLPMS